MITIKDEREIDLMRHAGHVVGLVHQELAKWLKPGLTTEQVSDFCEKIIRKNGCTPSFLNLYNFPGAVCTSVNDVVVHGIPNGYVCRCWCMLERISWRFCVDICDWQCVSPG